MKSSEIGAVVKADAEEILVEAETKAKSWFGKARAWFSGSSWKTKAVAIVGVVMLATAAINFVASGIEHVTAAPPVVAKAAPPTRSVDLTKVQKDAADAKASVADLTKAVTENQHEVADLKSSVAALDESLKQIVLDMRKIEEQIAASTAPKPQKLVTTGSVKPKAKSFDLTDPRTWPSP